MRSGEPCFAKATQGSLRSPLACEGWSGRLHGLQTHSRHRAVRQAVPRPRRAGHAGCGSVDPAVRIVAPFETLAVGGRTTVPHVCACIGRIGPTRGERRQKRVSSCPRPVRGVEGGHGRAVPWMAARKEERNVETGYSVRPSKPGCWVTALSSGSRAQTVPHFLPFWSQMRLGATPTG